MDFEIVTLAEKIKPVAKGKFEFQYEGLSLLTDFWRSRTITIPMQGSKSIKLKPSSPPKIENCVFKTWNKIFNQWEWITMS